MLFVIAGLAIKTIQQDNVLDHIEEYEVRSGETLWSIASNYRPETMSIQEYIYNLKDFNNIGSMIYPEQKINLLIYKEAK